MVSNGDLRDETCYDQHTWYSWPNILYLGPGQRHDDTCYRNKRQHFSYTANFNAIVKAYKAH